MAQPAAVQTHCLPSRWGTCDLRLLTDCQSALSLPAVWLPAAVHWLHTPVHVHTTLTVQTTLFIPKRLQSFVSGIVGVLSLIGHPY